MNSIFQIRLYDNKTRTAVAGSGGLLAPRKNGNRRIRRRSAFSVKSLSTAVVGAPFYFAFFFFLSPPVAFFLSLSLFSSLRPTDFFFFYYFFHTRCSTNKTSIAAAAAAGTNTLCRRRTRTRTRGCTHTHTHTIIIVSVREEYTHAHTVVGTSEWFTVCVVCVCERETPVCTTATQFAQRLISLFILLLLLMFARRGDKKTICSGSE